MTMTVACIYIYQCHFMWCVVNARRVTILYFLPLIYITSQRCPHSISALMALLLHNFMVRYKCYEINPNVVSLLERVYAKQDKLIEVDLRKADDRQES